MQNFFILFDMSHSGHYEECNIFVSIWLFHLRLLQNSSNSNQHKAIAVIQFPGKRKKIKVLFLLKKKKDSLPKKTKGKENIYKSVELVQINVIQISVGLYPFKIKVKHN